MVLLHFFSLQNFFHFLLLLFCKRNQKMKEKSAFLAPPQNLWCYPGLSCLLLRVSEEVHGSDKPNQPIHQQDLV